MISHSAAPADVRGAGRRGSVGGGTTLQKKIRAPLISRMSDRTATEFWNAYGVGDLAHWMRIWIFLLEYWGKYGKMSVNLLPSFAASDVFVKESRSWPQ